MLQKTRAIVINHLKYGDSSLIVRAYTEKYGMLSFIAHGIRKKKSILNPYLFETFSLLMLDLYYKQNRELQTLKDVQAEIILNHLHYDIRRSTIAVFLSEVIYRSLHEVEANVNLFNYLNHAIQILDVTDEGIENFHIIFLLQYSKFLGIHPKNNLELSTYRASGKVQLSHLLEYSLSEIGTFRITSKNRSDLIDQLVRYYYDHLEGLGELKSLPVLRTIFH